jgi:YfiH family protein
MSAGFLCADWPAPANVLAGTVTRDSDYELPAVPKLLRQVHGARVVHIGSPDFASGPPEADAVVANRPGDLCAVRTADCLPVMLCASDGSEVAAIHAGWRGLAAGIIEATISAMVTKPADLIVWLGPAISQGAFEVGDDVRDAFLDQSPAAEAAFVANDRGRWQADLYGLATRRLGGMGVFNVSGGGLCTYADPGRFYSYRRDGETGRMLNFVYLRAS